MRRHRADCGVGHRRVVSIAARQCVDDIFCPTMLHAICILILHYTSPVMASIDAAAFPHIIDSVLHHLHLSGQFGTLAACRLTCSALKRRIDSRLPRHRTLVPVDPVPPPRQTALTVVRDSPLWDSDTEGWRPTSFVVADLHVTGDLYWPRLSEAVTILRIFDYRALSPPCKAETLILFPLPTYFSPERKYNRCVELCHQASRFVINMRYAETPLDFAFRYAPEAELRNSMYRRIGVLEKRQELVLLFTPTRLELTEEAGAERQLLENWTHSVALAVRHNLALGVVLLVDGWNWTWFAQPEEEELSGIEDEHERLVAAFKRLILVYLDQAPETDPEHCFARIRFLTTAEYEAQVGSRMLHLMHPQRT